MLCSFHLKVVSSYILLFYLCFKSCLYLHVTIQRFNIATLQKLLTNQYVKWRQRPNIFVYIYQNTTICNRYLTNYCQICAINKYDPQIPHIYQLLHVKISDNYVSIYTSQTKTIYPQTLVYLHFTLKAYAPPQICLSHCNVHPTAIMYSTCRPQITAQRSKNKNKLQLHLPCYNHICASNICATQMPYIWYICQLLHVHI